VTCFQSLAFRFGIKLTVGLDFVLGFAFSGLGLGSALAEYVLV